MIILAFLLFASSSIIAGGPQELITSVKVEKNVIKISINEDFKRKYLHGDFYARYEKDINLEKLDYSVQILPFIMNIVSIIWISGKTYSVKSLDQKVYESLKTVKKIFKTMHSKTKWKGKLIPRKLVNNSFTNPIHDNEDKEHVALLFSGGLDSTSSSLEHRHKKQMLITVGGHWDLPLNDKKLWKTRKKELRAFGKKHGHENSFIKSNYSSFLNRWVLINLSPEIASVWRIFAVEGIGWLGLCAPIMLLKGYRTLLHGSTISWDFNYPAIANPFVDNNLFVAGARLLHDQFHLNRLQKCQLIAKLCKEENLERPYIRVCEEKIIGNCCKCQKCLRTILELVLIGENPHDYGFYEPVEPALKKSKKFMEQHKTGATTVWHFMHMQKHLQEKVAQNKAIPEDLRWILSVNLKKKKTTEIKGQTKVDWRDYQKFLPDLAIPDPLEKAF